MKTVVSCKNISYRISDRVLFDRLSFDLRPGEFMAVIGRNGAGKTTLLRNLTGEVKAGRGEVYIFDKKLKEQSDEFLATRRAVLPQSTPLNFSFSVLEVVLMGRIPHDATHTAGQNLQVALECLKKVGLSGFEKKNYLQLSGGEQQRVQLARVLAQLESTEGERLLFLDEPTSSLDISYQHKTLGIAKKFCESGGSTLAILHDLNLAARYADKILLLMNKGRHFLGTPDEVLTDEILSEAFDHPVRVIPHPGDGGGLLVLT